MNSSLNEIVESPDMASAEENQLMALIALGHTKLEQSLYEVMLAETREAETKVGMFSVRHLMIQTGLHSYSSIRRARTGLMKKLTIEHQKVAGDAPSPMAIYVVYSPSEIICRRNDAGMLLYPKEVFDDGAENSTSLEVIERLMNHHSLSRREAQVAIRCLEGLTNADIGKKLFIHEETVKFHLRNIFVKFGVKRRTELMANLFRTDHPDNKN